MSLCLASNILQMTALHMDWLAAASLVSSLPPLCSKDGTFDLVDTRRHNVIERMYAHRDSERLFQWSTVSSFDSLGRGTLS
jgi:hypothetical protein